MATRKITTRKAKVRGPKLPKKESGYSSISGRRSSGKVGKALGKRESGYSSISGSAASPRTMATKGVVSSKPRTSVASPKPMLPSTTGSRIIPRSAPSLLGAGGIQASRTTTTKRKTGVL